MRSATFCLLAPLFLLVQPAAGQGYSIRASSDEKKQIKEGVEAMHEAMLKGDVEVILTKTYPPLIRFSGGEKVFRSTIEQAITQLKTVGMTFESYELGEPSEMHLAGSEWVCFVPETSVALIEGKRFRSIGFIIGVRGGASSKWRYLEGVHLKKDPEALWRLFPDLSRTIKLPPIKQELLEDKPAVPK